MYFLSFSLSNWEFDLSSFYSWIIAVNGNNLFLYYSLQGNLCGKLYNRKLHGSRKSQLVEENFSVY